MHSARFSLSTARLFLRPISDSLVACNELMAAESLSGHLTETLSVGISLASVTVYDVLLAH